jgi:hypothetical protein
VKVNQDTEHDMCAYRYGVPTTGRSQASTMHRDLPRLAPGYGFGMWSLESHATGIRSWQPQMGERQ